MIYIRSLFSTVFFYGTLLLGCVITSVVGIFSRKATIPMWNYFIMPLCLFFLRIFSGIKIELRGTQYMKQEGVIYAMKHESALETYCMSSYITKLVFVLKKELTYIPIFGWAQYFYGMIPVDRSAGGAALKKMAKAVKNRLDNGRPLIIFPEGTRKTPGAPTAYKPGLAFLYQQLDTPVVPVATNTGLFWPKNSFLKYPGTVVVEFMEPIMPGLDKAEFMKLVEEKIETKCNELNQEAIKHSPGAANRMYKE